MTELSSTFLKQKAFYEQYYVYLRTPNLLLPDTPRIVLGDQGQGRCRFCGKSEPDVHFKWKAHAIPECLGNKSLFAKYECDTCNKHFGESIEHDLGNWSIVTRALAGIRGKTGIPEIHESCSQSGLKVTQGPKGLVYTEYGDGSIIDLDENNGKVRFNLKRYPYTPIAVHKALVRVGLTLLPDDEMQYFSEALYWIRNSNHSESYFKKCPVIVTFVPGPPWKQLILARLLRRKPNFDRFPYIYLVLGFAQLLFQIWLPCRNMDEAIWNKIPELPPFLPNQLPDPIRYGNPISEIIDLSGHETVRGDVEPHTLRFESLEPRK